MKIISNIIGFVLGLTLASAAQLPPVPPGMGTNAPSIVVGPGGGYIVSNPPPSITLSWTAPANAVQQGVAGYNLWQGYVATNGVVFTNIYSVPGPTTVSFTLSTNLILSTTYVWALTSSSTNAVNSVYSNYVTNTTPALPPAPTGLTTMSVLAANSLTGPWSAFASVPVSTNFSPSTFFRLAILK